MTCERLVFPSGCVESDCDRLYAYEEDGRTIVGCLEKVFSVEIDLERLLAAELEAPGFGGFRTTREPLPICSCEVDRTFAHRREGPCTNPEFLHSAPPHPIGARPSPAGTPDR